MADCDKCGKHIAPYEDHAVRLPPVITRVDLTFSDGVRQVLEGDAAKQWQEACNGQSSFCSVHGVKFPALPWRTIFPGLRRRTGAPPMSMTDERLEEIRSLREEWASYDSMAMTVEVVDELLAELDKLRSSATLDNVIRLTKENDRLRAVEAELRGELEQVTRLKAEIEKQFVDNCAIVQDYVQKHQLGLGGENIFKLNVRHAEELMRQLSRRPE